MIRAINAARRPVLALDVPSGLDADTRRGARRGRARRDHRVLRGVQVRPVPGRGAGARRRRAARRSRRRRACPCRSSRPLLRRIDESEIAAAPAARARDSHKGSDGRVLVIGGGLGMPGALRLAAKPRCASARGSSRSRRLTENLVAGHGDASRAHLSTAEHRRAASRSQCVRASVRGDRPGPRARRLGAAAVDAGHERVEQVPVVVDADALNLLALSPRDIAAALDADAASRRSRAAAGS